MSGVSIATGVIATDALGGGQGRGLQSPGVLAQSAMASSVTGTLTETALATIVIPARSMGTSGLLRITTQWTVTNSANNKSLSIRFGGTNFMAVGVTTVLTARALTEISNRNATNSQIGGFNVGVIQTFGSSGGSFPTGTIDTTVDQNLVILGTLTNVGETITLERYTVELINP